MGGCKVSYLFDESIIDRVIVSRDARTGKYKASVQLNGVAQGYSTFSTGDNPQIAITRALANTDYADRWRPNKF